VKRARRQVLFPALLLGAVAALAAAAGTGVRASYGAQVTGDEPHYLLTALSLAEDRSLDVSDEIEAGRYRDFHEVALDPQARIIEGGRMVAPHDPLLPLLLAPATALGGWVAAKLMLAVMDGVLAALMLWIAVRRWGVAPWAGAGAVGVFACSAPLAVYGQQLYPELPAALAATVAIAALTGPPTRPKTLVVCVAVVALLWLSVKYAPVAAVLAGIGLVRVRRALGGRAALAAALGLGLAGLVFVVAHQRWYGGWTPYAAGDHFVTGEFSVVGTHPDFGGRSSRLLGLLVDASFGLAAWQPAWLLLLPALGAALRARPREWHVFVLPLAAGWLAGTFVALTMHGWWWPGRQLVVVLPAAVLLIVRWCAVNPVRLRWLWGCGAIGVATHAWTVTEGLGGRLTWVVDFAETSNPLYRTWRAALPDLMTPSARTWLLHALWAVIAVALIARGWGGAASPLQSPPPARRERRIAAPSSR
jgi:hypothetical protein